MNENYCRIGGGLTRDPNVTTTRNGSTMVGLTVAVNGARYSSEEKKQVVTTEYVSVVAFGYMADDILQMGLGRGDTVVVEGQLSQQEVESDSGEKDRKTRINPWSVRLVNRPVRQQQPSPATRQPDQDPWQGEGFQHGGWVGRPTDEPPF